MNFEQIHLHLDAYKRHNQIAEAAEYLIRSFQLEHENFAGFGFREEFSPNSLLLTAEGPLGKPQKVMIPRNLFDFDLHLVLNMLAHEMLHVRQKAHGHIVEDKNEREFQAYYEMLFHRVFPQIPEVSDYHKRFFGNKALEYYKRMGEGSELQQKYAVQKAEIEHLIYL
ncbi:MULTISPECIES: hypothetical protein [Chryseobacterium]|uniref:SprT-like domain-containing protein n=1 Tax=Chryseobacterium camelliae TaxID=1265445 RepID=A0ABU0TM51_9FLAO|nr:MULTISPECIES: hypothetical protein [Chryseobacterium]MDT3408020.1 hypothetical protein [Pseudacidovorax intermedius]MDQ1098123.1 hypothetical protein [Chryseobacterium camelliae]MDQ1102053.1 hypothetical protein [Chryseobacterium sp. SORGH_AS_1048]MDR6085489.1 hypothetical protein [Chryseobacterium sp. SORGH_AS_0909]MDR6129853.1 hypothetical protein [Chryseobacterium sp. SORGH_AS_1175]